MVLFLAATLLALVFLLPLWLTRLNRDLRHRRGDVFSPVVFLGLLSLLNVPYLYVLAFDRSALAPDLANSPWVHDLETAAVHFTIVSVVTFACAMAGIYSPFAPAIARALPKIGAERFTPARTRFAVVAAGGTGVLLYLYYLHQIGGLRYLWANMYLRTFLAEGMGYLGTVYTLLLMFAALLLVYRLRFRRTPLRTAATVLGVLAVAVVIASTGGRSQTLHVLLGSILVHHYAVRRRRSLVTGGTMALGAAAFAFLLVVPLFRTSSAHERYSAQPELVVEDAMRSVKSIAPQLSGFDRTAVALSYFTPDRLWLGRSYLDLLTAPVPRSIYPNKPPVDDGVYLKAIAEGRPVRPPLPARELPPTSWPMGNMVPYMNFGVAGLLAGFFFVGIVVGAAYHYMREADYSVYSIYLYKFVLLGGFALSVYGIMMFLMNVTIVTLFFWTFFGRKRWPRPLHAVAGAPRLAGSR
jgi:hypothetical protein